MTSLFLPLNNGWLCACRNDVIHAVTLGAVVRWDQTPRSRRRKTHDTLCGQRAPSLYAAETVNDAGEPIGHTVLAWPPPARFDDHRRCTDCWDSTGRTATQPGVQTAHGGRVTLVPPPGVQPQRPTRNTR